MERSRALMLNTAVQAVVTMVLVWILMMEWGLLGAAYGMLAGALIGCVGCWIPFYALVPKVGDPAPALRVLQEFEK
jgi:O-antigen/teichoic acid export membrane protein